MSSSMPCNIPYMMSLIGKNIFSKIDMKKFDISAVVQGAPIELPEVKILDIGMGFGKWGFLIRDTFEVMVGQSFEKPKWKFEITGIEPFPKCITPIQKQIYDKIIQKDIFDVVDDLGKFDMIIMGDVIEHMEKEKAHFLLKKLFSNSENILISTPLGFMPQGAWAGNEFEIHKSGWLPEDFKQYTVVEHRITEDDLFTDLFKDIIKQKLLPKEYGVQIKILVLWIKK